SLRTVIVSAPIASHRPFGDHAKAVSSRQPLMAEQRKTGPVAPNAPTAATCSQPYGPGRRARTVTGPLAVGPEADVAAAGRAGSPGGLTAPPLLPPLLNPPPNATPNATRAAARSPAATRSLRRRARWRASLIRAVSHSRGRWALRGLASVPRRRTLTSTKKLL